MLLTQAQLLSGKVAEPLSQCVGTVAALHAASEDQYKPKIGDGTNGMLAAGKAVQSVRHGPRPRRIIKPKRIRQAIRSLGRERNGLSNQRPANSNGMLWQWTSRAFAVPCPDWRIRLLTDEKDTVLDPFSSSCTTLRVTADLGRDTVAIGLEEGDTAR